ncbi:MAG: hypothetical protein KTR14_01405 [Vampirovibrio sp.]|nr:hypothetical protein [Vampirovibrio sp.]
MCEIDWDLVLKFVSPTTSLLTFFVIVWGVLTWKNQVIFQKKLDLADEVAEVFSQMEDLFYDLRNPWLDGNEGMTRMTSENEDPEVSKLLNTAYIPIERLNKQHHQELFGRIYKYKFRFKIYFGKEAVEGFDTILEIQKRIRVAAKTNYQSILSAHKPLRETDAQLADEFHKLCYCNNFKEGNMFDDEIHHQVIAAQQKVLKVYKSVMQESIRK